jgi:hypothetical protein
MAARRFAARSGTFSGAEPGVDYAPGTPLDFTVALDVQVQDKLSMIT